MREHQWGRHPGFRSYRRCVRCHMVRRTTNGTWRAHRGDPWHPVPTPPCGGAPVASDRCTHVERIPMALGPGQTVRGGIKVGQCDRPALPRMVVCEHHATPDALRMVILAMDAELQRLTQLPDAPSDNPSEPAASGSTS